MVPLEQDRWAKIDTAYRNGAEIADWLRRLVEDSTNREAVWNELYSKDFWGALVHQGTVFEAAYEAIPYLIDVATQLDAQSALRRDILVFVGAIAGEGGRFDFPEDLTANPALTELKGYLDRAAALVLPSLLVCRDERESQYLLSALAAFSNCDHLYHVLFNMDVDEVLSFMQGEI
jgi:hypothetical protein